MTEQPSSSPRGRPRTFDHAEARRLRADEGLSYPAIGRALGIHHTTAMYACNAGYRERHKEATRDSSRWRREQRAAAS